MGWAYFPLEEGPCPAGPGYVGGWQITSYFGGRVDPITGNMGSHGGQDMAWAGCGGAAIYAPDDGTLSQSWDYSGGGNWSGITLDQGGYVGIGHAADFAPGASYRWVAAGELIGWVDSTGGSTGDHAHICWRPPGASSYADPYDLLMDASTRIVGDAGPGPGGEDDDMPTIEEIRFEMTGQHNTPTSKIWSGWAVDTRKYQNFVAQDSRTGRWWVLFGPFKYELDGGYAGYWRELPDVVYLGTLSPDPNKWIARIDTALLVPADGATLSVDGAVMPPEYPHPLPAESDIDESVDGGPAG